MPSSRATCCVLLCQAPAVRTGTSRCIRSVYASDRVTQLVW